MADDFRLGLRLTADGKGFVGEIRIAEKEVERLVKAVKGSAGPTDEATRATRKHGEAVKRTGRSFLEAHGRHLKYITSIGSATAAVRLADSYTDLSNRLRLVTDSEQELIATREQLLAVSLDTRTALDANTALFAVGAIDENTSASTALAGALNTVADTIKVVGLSEFSEGLNIARQAGTAGTTATDSTTVEAYTDDEGSNE